MGIGQAIASRFHDRGASIVILDLDPIGMEVAESLNQGGAPAVFLQCDVSDARQVEEAICDAACRFGGLDVVVNNAAISAHGSILAVSPQDWMHVIDVNLNGPFHVSRASVPHLIKRGGGAIVNIASVQGLAAEQDNAAYITSKGGLLALTRSMALDLASLNIRVNAVCPGAIQTERLLRAIGSYPDPAATRRDWEDLHAIRRLGTPDEVAEAVLFLAGERASFITGAALTVDGGMMASFGMAGRPV